MKLSAVIVGMLIIVLSAYVVGSQPTESDADEAVSGYINLSNLIWQQYEEDMTYSSMILNEFVSGNISSMDALTTTSSVFLLSSQTTAAAGQIVPPEGFRDYHHYTLQSQVNLQAYLWNLAKFYETEESQYALQARDNFNTSISYQEKARDVLLGFDAEVVEDEAEYMERIILAT